MSTPSVPPGSPQTPAEPEESPLQRGWRDDEFNHLLNGTGRWSAVGYSFGRKMVLGAAQGVDTAYRKYRGTGRERLAIFALFVVLSGGSIALAGLFTVGFLATRAASRPFIRFGQEVTQFGRRTAYKIQSARQESRHGYERQLSMLDSNGVDVAPLFGSVESRASSLAAQAAAMNPRAGQPVMNVASCAEALMTKVDTAARSAMSYRSDHESVNALISEAVKFLNESPDEAMELFETSLDSYGLHEWSRPIELAEVLLETFETDMEAHQQFFLLAAAQDDHAKPTKELTKSAKQFPEIAVPVLTMAAALVQHRNASSPVEERVAAVAVQSSIATLVKHEGVRKDSRQLEEIGNRAFQNGDVVNGSILETINRLSQHIASRTAIVDKNNPVEARLEAAVRRIDEGPKRFSVEEVVTPHRPVGLGASGKAARRQAADLGIA